MGSYLQKELVRRLIKIIGLNKGKGYKWPKEVVLKDQTVDYYE
ncbi:MAG: hypothetical protein RBR50_01840 [Candidatus Izemoplasmatales bacterium]|nr:hypothetical protein [Candidatus Izemoplasmatales bacterium]